MNIFRRFHSLVFMCLCIMVMSGSDVCAQQWGHWTEWGDQHNGTYRNPVMPADFSDIDCIEHDGVYYMISSTFQFQPGMIIMKSEDMVNWSVAGYAVKDIRQISKAMNYDAMDRYARGIWAGAIRWHQGRFYVYFGTPDEGYFMTSAERVEGPWDDLTKMDIDEGWDDPCPFFDEGGRGYLVGTCFMDNYKTYVFALTSDYKDVIPETKVLITESKGREASKLYKRDGWYYHLFSEADGNGRRLMIQRSKNIFGPYEGMRPMSDYQREFNEPNQGGFLQDKAGNWFFLTHHGSGDWSGRIASLLPVTWDGDWPVIGKPDAQGVGQMVWQHKSPVRTSKHSEAKRVARKSINRTNWVAQFWKRQAEIKQSAPYGDAWEWNYYPRTEMASVSYVGRRMKVSMRAFEPLEQDNLLKAGNILTTRSWRTALSRVTVMLNIDNMTDGQKAGICHMSAAWSTFGVMQKGNMRYLYSQTNSEAPKQSIVLQGRKAKVIYLRSEWGLDGVSHYSYSHDGIHYKALPAADYQLQWGNYRGDRLGLFTYNNLSESGRVSFEVLENRH